MIRRHQRAQRYGTLPLALALAFAAGWAAVLDAWALAEPTPIQGGTPTIQATLDTTEITLGGRVRLAVTVEHDAGTVVAWPDSLDLGPFEVLDAVVLEPQEMNGRVRSAARLTLTAFELGELQIPSVEVRLAGPDDAAAAALSTQPLTVSVVSVGRDESGDIRGIKDPLEIPRNWLLLWPWAIGVAGLAVAYWLFRRHRSRRAPPAVRGPTELPRPPHEVAYEALDRLERSGLLGKGATKAYYIEVSDIIRTYIEGRYGVDALEMATPEVLDGLETAGLAIETRLEFARFFEECDLVKFAKLVPEPAACRAIVPAARRLVDATWPVPVLVAEPTSTAGEASAASPGTEAGPHPPELGSQGGEAASRRANAVSPGTEVAER